MGRISEFLRLLHKFEEVVTHISQQPNQSISEESLRIIIRQIHADRNEKQIENIISGLKESDPPLISAIDDGTLILATRVTELLLWLSNKMYLVNDKMIAALVQELREISEKISSEMERPRINSHIIDKHLESMWRINDQLRDISESNKRAIGSHTQDLRDASKDYETKQMMAQLINDHLEPMRDLIDVESGVVNSINQAELVLGSIKSLHTMKDGTKAKSARLSSQLAATSVALREDHLNALSTIQPFLDVYLKRHSDLVTGANRALAMMNESGVSSAKIPSKISINLSRRTSNIFSDSNFAKCFQRLFSDRYEPRDLSINPVMPSEIIDKISVNQLTVEVLETETVPDIMQFILDLYPNHNLSSCSKACVDVLVKINDSRKIEFNENRHYIRDNLKLEVARIELLG